MKEKWKLKENREKVEKYKINSKINELNSLRQKMRLKLRNQNKKTRKKRKN